TGRRLRPGDHRSGAERSAGQQPAGPTDCARGEHPGLQRPVPARRGARLARAALAGRPVALSAREQDQPLRGRSGRAAKDDGEPTVTDTRDESSTPSPEHERLEDPVESAAQPETEARGWAPPRSGRKMTLLFVVFLLAGALLALYAWGLPPFRTTLQTTDNAYVRGQTTVVAPQVSGYVTKVFVQDFATVPAGAPLVQIDDRIYRQRVQQAQANLQTQIANLDNSQQSRRSSEA